MAEQAREDEVLETERVREVVGVVDSEDQLETLLTLLVAAGFDRSDIDIMATRETARQKLARSYADPVGGADDATGGRRPLVVRSDATSTTALVVGTLMAIGSLGAALPVLASGGALAAAIAAAVAGGAAATGIGKLIADHVVGPEDAARLERDLHEGGVVVFVRVTGPDAAERAMQAMREVDARNIRVQEVELRKTLRDIPLARIRPDPWLGDESLAAP
ncbi:MAG TPA: hypothetical protein VE684_05565 [Crenalkalicoccus sp.]|nr:hypothetical protein [Crenalkalicoccus sp.]